MTIEWHTVLNNCCKFCYVASLTIKLYLDWYEQKTIFNKKKNIEKLKHLFDAIKHI